MLLRLKKLGVALLNGVGFAWFSINAKNDTGAKRVYCLLMMAAGVPLAALEVRDYIRRRTRRHEIVEPSGEG